MCACVQMWVSHLVQAELKKAAVGKQVRNHIRKLVNGLAIVSKNEMHDRNKPSSNQYKRKLQDPHITHATEGKPNTPAHALHQENLTKPSLPQSLASKKGNP